MSDAGDEIQVDAPAGEVEVTTEAPKGKMTVEDALQQVLKNALVRDGLARGLRECAKALDKRQAHLCVLVETCTEAEYIKLIEALCAEHKINLIKIDKEGNPRKVVGCSCVVSEGLNVLLEYFKNR
ncbi:50S ribosomal protein L30e-like protein [Suillus paluster]|uniref:50S ribosomal protein L30e-like protein n=1 Tax=Suillus paluster TaxID=48578 RepID=UPI001B85BFF7|nr:50S ribosomal protein L30e-like protein [Suillus paluster]KAG1743627.1 50S ribosomal protein L30e-like protein [Suillus paluster]